MTKAAQIMALAKRNPSMKRREIAMKVYGEVTTSGMAYVRVVIDQREGRGESAHDLAYRTGRGKKKIAARLKRWKEENREHYNRYQREYQRKQRREARA